MNYYWLSHCTIVPNGEQRLYTLWSLEKERERDTHQQIKSMCQLFKSQKWYTWKFSLYFLYIISQTGNKNTQTCQMEVVILILSQIIVIYLQGNV